VSAPLDEVQQIVQEVAQSEGLELVDIEFKSGQSRSLLRIFLDKNGGVTLNDCESVSRQLSAILDVKDLIKNPYILEVSSPGIDRPFKTDRDYERSLGKMVRVQYFAGNDQTQSIVGILSKVDGTEIVIESGGQTQSILRDNIRQIRQEIPMSAPRPKKHSKRR